MGRNGLVILVLAILAYGFNFWGPSIYMLDEAKNAGCAAEMIYCGDYITPYFNGEYHDKPALQYYFMIAGFKLFGVNAFGARFFSVAMGIGMVLSVFWFTRRLAGAEAAFYTCLILISSLQLAVQFRLAVPDPYLLFLLVTALLAFCVGYIENNARLLYLFYALVALAFVAKGPIAFALPGLSILLFLLWRKDLRWSTLIRLKLPMGVVLVLLLGAPWYLAVGLATGGDWLAYFFLTHNMQRYVTTFEGHAGFPLDVVVIALGALIPFSFFLPQAMVSAFKKSGEDQALQFCICVCAAVFSFFLFSKTILPSYPEPCFPFIAIIIGTYLTTAGRSIRNDRLIVNCALALLVLFLVPLGVLIAIERDPVLTGLEHLCWYFIPLPIGGALALLFVATKRLHDAILVYAFSSIVTIALAYSFVFPAVDARNPVSRSKHLLTEFDGPVAYFITINPAYVFEYGKKITKLTSERAVQNFISSNDRALIITTSEHLATLEKLGLRPVFQGKNLFESSVSIVTVTP